MEGAGPRTYLAFTRYDAKDRVHAALLAVGDAASDADAALIPP
jgi:hypothetical protein